MPTPPGKGPLRFVVFLCVLESFVFALSWLLHVTHPLYRSSIVLDARMVHFQPGANPGQTTNDRYVNMVRAHVAASGAKYWWLHRTHSSDNTSIGSLTFHNLVWWAKELYGQIVSRHTANSDRSCYRLTVIDSNPTLAPIALAGALDEASHLASEEYAASRVESVNYLKEVIREHRQNGNEEAAEAVELSLQEFKSSISCPASPLRVWEGLDPGKEIFPFRLPLTHFSILLASGIGCLLSHFAKRGIGSNLNQATA